MLSVEEPIENISPLNCVFYFGCKDLTVCSYLLQLLLKNATFLLEVGFNINFAIVTVGWVFTNLLLGHQNVMTDIHVDLN